MFHSVKKVLVGTNIIRIYDQILYVNTAILLVRNPFTLKVASDARQGDSMELFNTEEMEDE